MESATPKLMLVENDPYFIYLLKLYAEQSGFTVVSTSSAWSALALAREESPTVIVLESDLPGMDGGEFLRSLRAEPQTQAIPVIVCLWQDSQPWCEPSHTEEVLHKPLQFDDFVLALKNIGVWPGDDAGKPKRPLLTRT